MRLEARGRKSTKYTQPPARLSKSPYPRFLLFSYFRASLGGKLCLHALQVRELDSLIILMRFEICRASSTTSKHDFDFSARFIASIDHVHRTRSLRSSLSAHTILTSLEMLLTSIRPCSWMPCFSYYLNQRLLPRGSCRHRIIASTCSLHRRKVCSSHSAKRSRSPPNEVTEGDNQERKEKRFLC